ncbi:MAG: chitobiase/beta-hexosaminidase C-terminal domain-containing protein [Verrucomicrobia bacterium]|nr:chitobiase/beta-hexosaminidase C-terminal domain-containing protein [Verrucomicrobiota bacterium]
MSANQTAGETRGASRAARCAIALLLAALVPAAALAQTTVTTLSGGPTLANSSSAGSSDGNTATTAQFNTPGGLAFEASGSVLWLADIINNTVRRLDLSSGLTTTLATNSSGGNLIFSTPVDVAVDANTNLYILTQGDGRIHRVDLINLSFGATVTPITAAGTFTAPNALAFDGVGNLYVVEEAGALRRVALSNFTVSANLLPAGTFIAPRGVEVLDSGKIAVSDATRHTIHLVDPNTLAVTFLAGVSNSPGTATGIGAAAQFNSPRHLAKAGNNILVVADQGNHQVRLVDSTGATTVLYGIQSNFWVNIVHPSIYPGWADGTSQFAESRLPTGVVVDGSGTTFVTEQFYHVIRKVTGSGLTGPSGVGSGGSASTLNPPSLSFSPNTGYFPLGTTITVTSSSTNVFYTTDGSAPTTNSTPVAITGGVGVIQWRNAANDLTGLRVAAFLVSGTNTASTNVTGIAATSTTIGVPASLNTNIFAGVGSRVVVPIVLNLRTNDTLRTLQFRVEVSTNGTAPMVGATFGAQPIGTNDFITVTTGGASAAFSSLAYTAGATRGIIVTFLGTNANLLVNRFAVAALLTIPIPATATPGQSYNVDILLPTGTSDGGQNSVAIAAAGTRVITVTNLSYRVGDTSPGGWYNAGDFGNGNLDNADVNNAFAAASGSRLPFAFSDAFDAMDAFPEDTAGTVGGDGQIRFLDWQIILLRALRLNTNPALGVSTTNWSRTWAGGVRTTGVTNLVTAALQPASLPLPGEVWNRQAALGALPLENVVPGTTVNVPVFARVAPGAALAGLQFRAVVSPADGAPALAQQAQFIPSLPNATIQPAALNAVVSAWNVGQVSMPATSSNLLGFVRFTVPATATAGASYAVSFANADGSPDFFTQYSFETRAASVWVGRPAPAPLSIISDEWKVAFFGNAASADAADLADPDGDGVVNALEYLAGTDPTRATSRVQLAPGGWRNGGRDLAFQLLSAPGKLYVLESNTDLISPNWTPVVTISGDGNLKEFIQAVTPGGPRYFRLKVLP